MKKKHTKKSLRKKHIYESESLIKEGSDLTAGDYDISVAGNEGVATVRDYGVATVGQHGTATASNHGVARADEHSNASTGDYGVARVGHRGTATTGYAGVSYAGWYGTARTGRSGVAKAGLFGCAAAGAWGIIVIEYEKELKIKLKVGVVGEDGIKPNTLYKLDSKHNFVEVPNV